ncbi:MAG: SprT-like domain-containing protein [Candidatus Accumulibacter propinquus]
MGANWLRRAAAAIAETVFAPAGICCDVRGMDFAFTPNFGAKAYVDKDGVERIRGGAMFGGAAVLVLAFRNPVSALDVLTHELIHVVVPTIANEDPHGPRFQRIADAVGLTPPYTATKAGPELRAKLVAIAESVGPMPMPYFDHPSVAREWHEKKDGVFVRVQREEFVSPRKRYRKTRIDNL